MAGNTSDLILQVGFDIDKFSSELSKTNNQFRKFEQGVKATALKLAAAFGIGFGLDKVRQIGENIIAATGEFQRFQAVLTNTLGSQSLAQAALNDIKEFAASTPFEVAELTAAFVKLANQGFQPTTIELRKLGDLSSSVGKSFDQLAEAIIDAQTGEFERLKEFGIRASKEGDKVTFTFKGVKKQVDFTSESIREYVLSLGDATGVSGSMAAISQTLEGRISNLKDSWGQLMITIGEGNSGPLFAAVKMMDDMVKTMQLLPAFFEQFRTGFEGLSDKSLDSILAFADTDSGKAVRDVIKPITDLDNTQFFGNIKENMRQFVKLLTDEGEDMSEVLTLWKRYVAVRVESTKIEAEKAVADRAKAVQDAINKAADAFKKLNEERKKFAVPQRKGKDVAPTTFEEQIAGFDSPELKINAESEAIMRQTLAILANNAALLDSRVAWQNQAKATEEAQEKAMLWAGAISAGLDTAINDQLSASQKIIGITNSVINALQQQALAYIIANWAKIPNPAAALIGATAGFAAIKALFSKIGGSGGGGGGSGGGSIGGQESRLTPIIVQQGQRIPVEITLRGDAGKMINAMVTEQNRRDAAIKG